MGKQTANEDDKLQWNSGSVVTSESAIATAYVKASVIGGLVAGFVFLVYQIIIHSLGNVLEPFKIFASLFLAEEALAKSAPLVSVVLVGLLDHLLVSLFWGLVFGLILAMGRCQWTPGYTVALGILFGSIVWVVDFYLFAPVFWPWLELKSTTYEFIGHTFFFGLPLGVWVASRTKLLD